MDRIHRLWPLLIILLLLLTACGGGAAEAETGGGETGGEEAPAEDAVVINMENAKETIQMKIGQTALVKLDPAYNWSLAVTPALVADKVKDATLAEDTQAEIAAKLAGSAVIQATGNPKCKDDNPPCDTARQQLNIKLKVSP